MCNTNIRFYKRITVHNKNSFATSLVMVLILAFILSFVPITSDIKTYAASEEYEYNDARPSKDGTLSVRGTYIVNSSGEKVTLRGISTHGLTWYPDYINESLFKQVSEEWGCNLLRLPMYSEEYLKDEEYNLEMLHKGIEAAIKADMYVIVDWHILNDNNPKMNMKAAGAFLESIAEEYADTPNVIFEICNEPNGNTTWDDIYDYSNYVIPMIRKHSPDSIIIVGTPDYDRDLISPYKKQLHYDNVMYSFHFYTASHYDEMYETLEGAVKNKLPVFISESGISEADGNGRIDYENAEKWYSYLHDHNISYVIWNLSNKQESSSFIKATSPETEKLTDDDLTDEGKWVRSLLQGENPENIEQGATEIKYSLKDFFIIQLRSLGKDGIESVKNWYIMALICLALMIIVFLVDGIFSRKGHQKISSYDDLVKNKNVLSKNEWVKMAVICASLFITSIYLCWRIRYSINVKAGWLAVFCNVILLIVELIGFVESCIHYGNMMNVKEHPLPHIEDDEYPEVDIFIATYNEPEELLRKTIIGCKYLKYPDPSKVHIWVCDDNRRSSMRKLAESMGVGYFDRPDNSGAKAGNLNNALSHTSAPYVVTLDSDMIVRSDFLLKTIPYFVDAEKHSARLPKEKRKHLGLLQSPQCFYNPDVFQYTLYSENNVPNEQDFFYRTIEVGKTSTNSVIYGGSNTIISRQALVDIGGFYTESITEDFATGMLIESAGYLSLAIDEPLASGQTPHTFSEHIKQRTRWGRGVINTAKSLKIFRRKELDLKQKLSYWSSAVYWFSPLKNLIYIMSPLFFATFTIPVFKCNWLELLIFWLPMFILQDVNLRVVGKNKVSLKWSGIYETSVMPYLLIPIIKESLGMSLSKFQVTDKSKKASVARKEERKMMAPFIILLILSVLGIIRVICILRLTNMFGIVIILFWLIRNLYFIIMVMFMISGRDDNSDVDEVYVKAAEEVDMRVRGSKTDYPCITSSLTDHQIKLFVDENDICKVGDIVDMSLTTEDYNVKLNCIVINVLKLRHSEHGIVTVEILDYNGNEDEYVEILHDRIPTLPQSLKRDFGLTQLFWRNVAYRLMRTVK